MNKYDLSPFTTRISLRQAATEFKSFGTPWKVGLVTLLIVTFLPLLILVLLTAFARPDGGAVFFLILIAGGGLYGLLDVYREINERSAASAFARINGFVMERDQFLPAYSGTPFRKRFFVPYLLRSNQGLPFEFGYLRPQLSRRRSSSSITYSYVKLSLPVTLPHILLKLRGKPTLLDGDMPGSSNFRLEGEFGDRYDVVTASGQERDALYIFTPDVMARFLDAFGDFEAEIVGTDVYLYSSTKIPLTDPGNFSKLLTALNSILPKFGRQADRFTAHQSSKTDNGTVTKRLELAYGRDALLTTAAFIGLSILAILLYLI